MKEGRKADETWLIIFVLKKAKIGQDHPSEDNSKLAVHTHFHFLLTLLNSCKERMDDGGEG